MVPNPEVFRAEGCDLKFKSFNKEVDGGVGSASIDLHTKDALPGEFRNQEIDWPWEGQSVERQ